MPDPNWLLSTSAQSAAAIVAIIGGFLVSRIVTLSSERSGTQARLAEIRQSRDLNANRLEAIETEILERDVQDFVNFSVGDIVERRGEISLEQLMSEHPPGSARAEELQPYYESLIAGTRQAFDLFERVHPLEGNPPVGMEDYLKRESITVPEGFAAVFERAYRIVRRAYLATHSRYGLAALVEDATGPSYSTPYLLPETNHRYRELVRDRDGLHDDATGLQAQVRLLEDRLVSLGRPAGLAAGIGVLAYFSVVGIVLPIWLMHISDDAFTPWHKWGVTLSFVTGLGGVLCYLWTSFQALSD